MKPVLIHILGFPLYAYGFMIMLGFIMAMMVAVNRFRSQGLNHNLVFDFGLLTMVSGIVGARIFYVVQYNDQFQGDFKIFNIFEGLAPLGIFLGILLVLACYRNSGGSFTLLLTFIALIFVRYQGWTHHTLGQFHPVDLVFVGLLFYQVGVNVKNIKEELLLFTWRRALVAILILGTASLLGARILHLYLYASDYKWRIFMIWKGGIVFYGGFILGTISAMAFMRRNKLPILKVTDALTPSVALGLAFTRFGCFLNGCCFGGCAPDNSPFGVVFPPNSLPAINLHMRGIQSFLERNYIGSTPYDFKNLSPELYEKIFNQSIYPTQLFESISAFILFLILLKFYKYRKNDGEVILMFGILYSIARFLVEILRDDTPFVLGTGLKAGQAVSVVLFLICLPIFIMLRTRKYFSKSKSLSTESVQ